VFLQVFSQVFLQVFLQVFSQVFSQVFLQVQLILSNLFQLASSSMPSPRAGVCTSHAVR
jgi:hypothetical protein